MTRPERSILAPGRRIGPMCGVCARGRGGARAGAEDRVNHEGVMGDDSGGEGTDRDAFVDADDDQRLESEIVRWLQMYAGAANGRRDATVAAIFDQMNRLLRRYRWESAAHRADYGSRLR